MLNKSIKIFSQAKINWFLNVQNLKTDGYHQLQTFMQKISLYDIIYIESIDENIINFYDYNNKCFCPVEKNIIVRTALKLKNIFNIGSGAFISIEKNIPVCAGLGGGSSNAASVLNALVKIWEINISDNELNEIAASLGADVPFFLKTTAGICEGIGEKITPVTPGDYDIVLWNPKCKLSTPEVYNQFDKNKREQKNIECFLDSYSLDDLSGISTTIWNNLALAADELYPELIQMRQSCLDIGAVASWVSGSGPTVVSLCDNVVAAKKLADELRRKHPGDYICECKTVSSKQ